MQNNNSLIDETTPLEFYLSQNYPNPFKKKTTIKYCVAYKTKVQIRVFNHYGEVVESLVDEEKQPGTYEVLFSISDCKPFKKGDLSQGYYYYQMTAGDYTSEKKWFCINNLLGKISLKLFSQSLFLLLFITTTVTVLPQTNEYWKDAPLGSVRIYTVFFTSDQNGYALSLNSEFFISSDSGTSWRLKENSTDMVLPEDNNYIWLAEIYCSTMRSSDGGKNWSPCPAPIQEHFCGVFLKDPNVGYKTASEFLNTVSLEIFSSIKKNSQSSLIHKPQQCTEYYSSEKEVWSVGWYLRELKTGKWKNGIKQSN